MIRMFTLELQVKKLHLVIDQGGVLNALRNRSYDRA